MAYSSKMVMWSVIPASAKFGMGSMFSGPMSYIHEGIFIFEV